MTLNDIQNSLEGIRSIAMTLEEKYREVARQTDVREHNIEWIIQDFTDNVNSSHSYQLDEEEYKNSMTVEEMITIVSLYRCYG